jgi:aryl-alcohol dehydrogenase-like predicted oxidoreductase
MRSLQRTGAIGEVGVSNYSLARWRAAEKALGSRVISNQVEYNLVHRSPERELLPFAESHDRIIIAFSPLAMGLLSGKYHGSKPPVNLVRAANSLFRPENIARTSHLIKVLHEVADAHSANPAQIALAWVIHSPAVVAIPGAASVAQLESNVAAADIKLADDEYLALRQASAQLSPPSGLQPSANDDTPESESSIKSSLKHSVRSGLYVAKIVRRNYRPFRAR